VRTQIFSLRKHIREIITELFNEEQGTRFSIKFSEKKKLFVLYKRFIGLDQYDNKNEQIVAVADLSANPKEAQEKAKEITGQDLVAKMPSENQTINRGKTILPFDSMKGKRLEEVPIDYLIQFLLGYPNKYIDLIKKDPYKVTVYEYLTQDLRQQTIDYFKKQLRRTRADKLINIYNEYKEKENKYSAEKIAFGKILLPILRAELTYRMIQFDANGKAIIYRTS
jgi:hypothetical protein